MRVLLFGQPALTRGLASEPLGAERRVQLLCHLACVRDWVDRERLALLFWSDHDAEAARRNVRKVLHRARELPWLESLESRGSLVRWVVPTDVAEFDARLAEGDHGAALALYRGPLLDGLERSAPDAFVDWLLPERQRRAQARRRAVLAAVDAAASADQRLRLAQLLLADDPLDEDAVAVAMQAEQALGQAVAARVRLAAYGQRLAAQTGVEPSARLRGIVGGTRAAAPSPGSEGPDFVGRRLELRQIAGRLRDPVPRVLVLHGPGGIGKSRLAREAMAEVAGHFADGVHWIALDDLSTPDPAGARIAQALGLTWRDGDAGWRQLARRIGERRALLVLDNAEHLGGLGARLKDLVDTCPRLRVLLTSRSRVEGLDADLLTLEGLAVPDDASLDAEAAASFDAVRLFVRRAEALQPLPPAGPDRDAVAGIVRRVGGLPLAIELAAAWVRLLPPREIARELDRSMDLLEGDPASASPVRPEHASMRAVLESSWALLAPAERDAMCGLAVFTGGFTREAAQAVAGATMPLLASLADKSLVQVERERGRFDLHPLVAAHVRERSQRQPDAAAAAVRHSRHFAVWLEGVGALATRRVGEFRARVEPDLANCMAAFRAAVAARDAESLAKLTLPLATCLNLAGRLTEGVHLLGSMLDLPAQSAAAHRALAPAHRMVASMSWSLGRQEDAHAHARLGIAHARRVADTASIVSCLCTIGLSLEGRNRPRHAGRWYRISLRVAEALGAPYWIAVACTNLGGLALQLGDVEQSLRQHDRSLRINRSIDNVRGVMKELNNLGNAYRVARDWTRAARYLGEGLEVAQREASPLDLAYVLVNLGLVEQERGRHDAAVRCFERTIALRDRGAHPWLVVEAHFGLTRVAARQRDAATARLRLDEGITIARGIDHEHYLVEAAIVTAEVLAAEGDAVAARALCAAVLVDSRADETLRDDTRHMLARLGAGDGEALPPAADLDEFLAALRTPPLN